MNCSVRWAFLGWLLAVSALSGCSSLPGYQPQPVAAVPLGNKVDMSNQALVKSKLNSQYSQWQGTRHRTGGMSQSGVDCSAYVYLTFREQLGVELPRSTELQARVGTPVDKNGLRAGDLVFFKTGLFKGRHVGIYMGDNRFMHVSSSRGVMISGMDDYYWRDRYWQARRI